MSNTILKPGMTLCGHKLMHMLGTGSNSEVWAALHNDGHMAALKLYRETAEAGACHELEKARFFSNCHILQPTGADTFEGRTIVVLPYCVGRSADSLAAFFSERMIWQLIADTSHALAEIHSKNHCHFGIKPSHILWDGSKFLLTDFATCRSKVDISHNTDSRNTANNDKGGNTKSLDNDDFRYQAPERYTLGDTACDIWSLGATIFRLYMGCHVFNGLGGRAQQPASPLPYMRKSQPTLSLLVQDCLNHNPAQRPTAQDINTLAQSELTRLSTVVPQRKPKLAEAAHQDTTQQDYWPELMDELSTPN